jgi:hypothetical protein
VIGSDYDNDGSAYIYDLRDIVGVEGTDPVRGVKPWMSAFPNPSSSTVMVRYNVPRWSDVRLTAYDLLGRTVRELAPGNQPAGTYEVSLDATGLPSGVYFYRLQAGDNVETKRMVVVK